MPPVAMALLVVVGGVVWLALRWSERQPGPDDVWATRRDLGALRVRPGDHAGRVVLGRAGRGLVATEKRHSVLVLGPTDTLKTTGFAEPAILEWEGPVLAFSVKSDLVAHTFARRAERGSVWAYDPFDTTCLPGARWTPLAASTSWAGAERTAEWMCAAAKGKAPGPGGDDFWHQVSAMMLAPLLFGAATSEATMADVVQWVRLQLVDEPQAALRRAGVREALDAFVANMAREERQLSGIYTTTETVLRAFADPEVARSLAGSDVTARALLDRGPDGDQANTLYVCAPSDEMDRYEAVFTTLARQFLATAMRRGAKEPLDPPLLVVLDEAANVAPIRNLATLASTARSHGVQLVTVFQDFAQIRTRYGDAADTVVNNHRAKVILGASSDQATLSWVTKMIGDATVGQRSTTHAERGRASTTESTTWRPVAPAEYLRQVQPGQAVLLYGDRPPARIRLRPWFADKGLRSLVEGDGEVARRRRRWSRRWP